MSVRILLNLGEVQDLVAGSMFASSANSAEAPTGMVWTPPFSFGDEDEFRFGGFTFIYTDGTGDMRATFYRFSGTVDMFMPRKACTARDVRDLAQREASQMLQVCLCGLQTPVRGGRGDLMVNDPGVYLHLLWTVPARS